MGKKNNKSQEEMNNKAQTQNDNSTVKSNEGCGNFEENEIYVDLAQLRKDLEQKEQEAKNNLDSLQRIMAEFDNYKKRTIKEKENIYTDIKADIMSDFLEIVDNLDKALENSDKSNNLTEGIVLIQKKLLELLRKYGVEEIEALNKTFDPNIHESIQHIDDENYGEKEIVEVYRKGYKLGDKVIRYPMVKVAN